MSKPSDCPRCKDSGVVVVDTLPDGTNVLGDCPDCVERECSKEEAMREDAREGRMAYWWDRRHNKGA